MIQSMIEKKYPEVVAKREREFNEVQKKKEEEKKKMEDQRKGKIPVIYSNAHVFKGMKAKIGLSADHRRTCRRLIFNAGMGNPVAYLKIRFTDINAPYALVLRPGDTHAMNGFLVRIKHLE